MGAFFFATLKMPDPLICLDSTLEILDVNHAELRQY